MKIEGSIFLFVGIFLAGTDVVYWLTSHDPTGTTALALGSLLGLLVATYLLVTAKRMGPRPEDLDDADISDGAGEIGFFSPYSWAPLWCAGSAAIIFTGVVFGRGAQHGVRVPPRGRADLSELASGVDRLRQHDRCLRPLGPQQVGVGSLGTVDGR
jgi:hypothetical protein